MSAVVTEPLAPITPEQQQTVFALYDQGLYLQAYELGTSIAPLHRWRGTTARILAGRMAGNLGSQRLGDWHFVHAYRQDPTHPDACWYFANYLANRRGPLPAWRFLRQVGDLPAEAPLESRAHWLALHGTVLGRLRDFDAAEEWLARAEALGPAHPWVVLERAALYALEDKNDEAEQAARRALQIRPWYRPALQWVAHFLVEKERDQEARELLEEAGRRLESCALWSQLAGLQLELKRYEDAGASLAQFERLAPLLDKDMAQWLEARRSDVAYHLGDFDRAGPREERQGRLLRADRQASGESARRRAPSRVERRFRAPAPPDVRPGDAGVVVPLLGHARRAPGAGRRDFLRRHAAPQ